MESTKSTFSSFSDAVRAAQDGDILEVCSDGPFLVDGLSLERRITIRAGVGSRPVFRNRGQASQSPFIHSRSDVSLDGIKALHGGIYMVEIESTSVTKLALFPQDLSCHQPQRLIYFP